jgi:hypothetical protein
VLNWSFLNWSSKLTFIFGILFSKTFYGAYYVFSLYPEYRYIFILIVIVLFFQTWNTIRLTFRRNGFKWMGISIVIVSSLSFGLSKINLVDYKKINNAYLQHNIYHKYTLELPVSNTYEIIPVKRATVKTISVVESKENNPKPIIVMDTKEIELKDISHKIMDWQSIFHKYDIRGLVYHLQIHRNIKMEFISKIALELSKAGVSEVAYAVVPANAKYDKKYYLDYSFTRPLLNYKAKLFNLQEFNKALDDFENIIEIKQLDSGDYLVDSVITEPSKFKQSIKNSIQTNPDYFIKLYTEDKASFSSYFTVLSYTKEAIVELRNEYALKSYTKEYDQLDDTLQKEVEDKYPFHVFELTSELLKAKN